MTSRDRWEQLQERWAQGEHLSAAEERERLALASQDPLARRELEIFSALRARANSEGEPVPQAFIDGVLDAVRTERPSRLVDQLRSPRWRLALAFVLLAAGLGFVLLGSRASPSPVAPSPGAAQLLPPRIARAQLLLVAGQVRVDEQPSRSGLHSLAERQVLASADGRACFSVDETVEVCLGSNSTVVLESLVASRLRVRVEMGVALASLSRRNPGSSFALLAGDISAVAHGTTFAARRERGETEITVLEGVVEVTDETARSQQVRARSGVLVRGANAWQRTAVGPEQEAQLLDLRAAHELWTGGARGVLELGSSASAAARVNVDDQGALPLPLRTFVNAGRHRVSFRDAEGNETGSWVNLSAGETRRLEAPVKRVAPATTDTSEEPSPASLLEAARREATRGNARGALALYEKLRAKYPASSEARTVLATMGKLELDLNQPHRALALFEAYLRNPGSLAPEALAGKIRSLRALGRPSQERQALQQYLARYPDGLEAPLFQKRLAELTGP